MSAQIRARIRALTLDSAPGGTWTYASRDDGGNSCGGSPFPSEAEAHAFMTAIIPDVEEFISSRLTATFLLNQQR